MDLTRCLLRFFYLLCFFAQIGSSYGQFHFRHLTTKDGLIQGSVYFVLEDREGFIWMTTQAGLNRFDGQQFKSFTHDDQNPNSIGKGEVRGLFEAPNGDIWMGTEVALSRYVPGTGKFINYYHSKSDGTRLLGHHQAVFADDSLVLYLSELEGLSILNWKTGVRRNLLKNAGYTYQFKIETSYFDKDKRQFWMVLPFGVLCLDIVTGKKKYFFTGRADDSLDRKRVVYAINPDLKGRIWLSTDEGMILLGSGASYSTFQIGIDLKKYPVFSFDFDNEGLLWIATPHDGIIVYNTVGRRVVHHLLRDPFKRNSLAGPLVGKVHVDKKGRVWANVDPQGIDVISPNKKAVVRFEDNPIDDEDLNKASVRGIGQDRHGNLWVGTSGEGLRRILTTGKFNRFTEKQAFLPSSVRGVMKDSRGAMWICTLNGLYVYREKQERFHVVKFSGEDPALFNYVKGIIEISPQKYLVATMAGMFWLEQGKHRLATNSADRYSGAMYYDRSRSLLFAGRFDKDLQCYALRGDSLVAMYNALPGYGVLTVAAAGTEQDTSLWVGTDNGLIKLDKRNGKRLQTYTAKNGLPDHVVYSVVPDQSGYLWLSTNNGLVRFREDVGFQHIRHTAGVEFNSFAAFRADDGKIYFGSTQGLICIQPESFNSPSSGGLKISGIWVSDSTYYPLDEFKDRNFSHRENDLIFELAALDYTSEVAPIYEYRLDDSNGSGEWVSNQSFPIVRFRNLSPDYYKLSFRVLDGNGMYSYHPEIRFRVESPFWMRSWFWLICTVLTGGGIYAIVRLNFYRQRRAQQSLTRRIVDAQESERFRIAMDIHDDVNNTLAAAKGYLERFEQSDLADFENTRRSKVLIQKASDDLRAITHDLMPVDFEKYELDQVIKQKVGEWNEASPIELTYLLSGSIVKLRPESELMIYRVVLELLQNTRKHSKADYAILQLVYQDESLVVSMEDNGEGFREKAGAFPASSGIGLKNLYSRAEYLNGSLEVNSDSEGVLVQLSVPYAQNRYDQIDTDR